MCVGRGSRHWPHLSLWVPAAFPHQSTHHPTSEFLPCPFPPVTAGTVLSASLFTAALVCCLAFDVYLPKKGTGRERWIHCSWTYSHLARIKTKSTTPSQSGTGTLTPRDGPLYVREAPGLKGPKGLRMSIPGHDVRIPNVRLSMCLWHQSQVAPDLLRSSLSSGDQKFQFDF